MFLSNVKLCSCSLYTYLLTYLPTFLAIYFVWLAFLSHFLHFFPWFLSHWLFLSFFLLICLLLFAFKAKDTLISFRCGEGGILKCLGVKNSQDLALDNLDYKEGSKRYKEFLSLQTPITCGASYVLHLHLACSEVYFLCLGRATKTCCEMYSMYSKKVLGKQWMYSKKLLGKYMLYCISL